MTVTIGVTSAFIVRELHDDGTRTLPSPDEISTNADRLMEALLDLEESCGVEDSAISANLAEGTIEVSVVAHGDTYEEAEATAQSCVRTAIHAIGGHTPDWRADFEVQNRQSELLVVA